MPVIQDTGYPGRTVVAAKIVRLEFFASSQIETKLSHRETAEDIAKIASLDSRDGRIGPDPDTANF
jgi:hypothetical protein